MKNRIIALAVCLFLIIGILPMSALAAENDDIVILYENDVHCEVNGYSKLAALKKEMQETYNYVGVVSGGDYIQGNSLGVISQGEYIVGLMNLVGYDAVTLGNHEFDFRIERLNQLVDMMNTKPISCNFGEVGAEESYFDPYTIVTYGDVNIAYIGITTPSTITTASPTQFKDENGNFIYTFNNTALYDVVQANIDAAKAEGADYIIALSHIGYAEDEIYGTLEDVETLIANTDGFDVVLDAHSHTVIENMQLVDKGGNTVVLSSTGTKFEYIGKLTISDGEISTELVSVSDYAATDPIVDAYIAWIYEEYGDLAKRKVAVSDVNLIIKDANGKRLVRTTETNLGDFCADAFRYAVDADIGYLNGGGLRADISAGEVTFNDLLNVLPFNNTVVLAEISGATLRDMMEMAMRVYPEENGAFPHLSGLIFSVNTSIPSSVVLDENEEFVTVNGEYRVYDMKVYNRESGAYEPIDLNATYTFAASNFFLLDHGSGMSMLNYVKILQNDGILDVEALERYVNEVLGGVIGQQYAEVGVNITFTSGVAETPDGGETETPDDNEGTTTPDGGETPDDNEGTTTPDGGESETPDNPTVNPPVTPGETPEKLDTGAVVAIVIASTVVVGIGTFAIIWFVIKKKKFSDIVAMFKK